MRKVILLYFLLAILIVTSCKDSDLIKVSTEDADNVCEEPYIRYASGCCLDRNGNSICDNNEKTVVVEEERIVPEYCKLDIGSGLFCDRYSVSSNQISLSIKNAIQESITITSLSVTNSGCNPLLERVTIPGDDKSTLTLERCSIDEKIDGVISIIFEDKDGFVKTVTGNLVAKVK